MNRNKELPLRTPEPTSLSRGTAFNRHTAGEFYNLLEGELTREQFMPDSITVTKPEYRLSTNPAKSFQEKDKNKWLKLLQVKGGRQLQSCVPLVP
jgi:hypothetical protein